MEVAIKTGLLVYAVSPDQSSGDFGAFPHKQRPSILSAGSEGSSLNRISIKKQERVRRRPALRRRLRCLEGSQMLL